VIELLLLAPGMLGLLLMKGFFSGSEIALVSADKLKLRTAADRGDRRARLVLRLFRNPESLLATTLIGTNIATMTLSVLAAATMIELVGRGGDLLATLVFAPIMLIFGEIVPKSIFQQRADSIAPRIAGPLALIRGLLMPLAYGFGWVGRRVSQRLGPQASVQSPYVTRQRLRLMLESAERAAEAPSLDRDRIRRAIRLSDMTAGEAMIPLAQVVGAPASHSVAELRAVGRASGHRRIPLYEGNISNIVSIAAWTVWDEAAPDFEQRGVDELTAPPHFASIIQRLDELLPVLLSRPDRMVVAVDEFGTATGVVTLEDLMTILLGDVARGAHFGPQAEAGEIPIEDAGDEVFIFDARARLAEVGELLDVELPAREFHTLGGLLTSRLRRIPAVGDSLVESGQKFTVLEATSRAATRVRVEPAS